MDYFNFMGTFLERINGSSRILRPGQEVKLQIASGNGRGDGGCEAAFAVKEDELFNTFGVVRRTSPEFVVELGKDGVLPWEEQNEGSFAVWRQGVKIKHRPTGKEIEVIYFRDR